MKISGATLIYVKFLEMKNQLYWKEKLSKKNEISDSQSGIPELSALESLEIFYG